MMFHRSTEPFIRYLLTTSLVGGALGIAHGVTATANKKELRPAAILHDGMAGVIAGPWSPVFVPLVLTGVWPCGCPYKNLCRK
jgi:hypothetical protein